LKVDTPKYVNNKIPSEKLILKISKGGGAVLLLWDNNLSPFGINRQKRSLLGALFTFSPIGTSKYE
jgi:hypothetical protein